MPTKSVVSHLAIDTYASSEEVLLHYLLQQVVRLTGLPVEAVEPSLPWDELGVDSIMLARVKYELEREIDLQIPLRLLAETDSLQSLASAIDNHEAYVAVRETLLAFVQKADITQEYNTLTTYSVNKGQDQRSATNNGDSNGHCDHPTDNTVDDLKTIDWLYSNLLNDVDKLRRS